VHTYDCEDKTKSSQESDDEQEPDPIDNEIRHGPVTISPIRTAAPLMSTTATRTAPTIAVMVRGRASPPPTAGITPESIQNKFNAALRQTDPPRGGGGPGGPAGPGRPGGPGRLGGLGVPLAQVPQQLIAPAADVKTIGQLPQIFTGD
jgi:hypothetical protein